MKAVLSSLQTEIQQNTPFPSVREEAILSILRTADLVRTSIGDLLAPYGITMQQYNVLRILRGAGEAGLQTLSIGDRMIESAPGITRLLDRMESRHWVIRERCKIDRRVVHARISPEGLRLLASLDEPLRCSTVSSFTGMDEPALGQLVRLLAAVRQSIHPGTPPAPAHPCVRDGVAQS